MQLVDEGLLDLDTPVVEVLPELRLSDPDVTKSVTIRHLLTHTSGIDGDVFTDTGRGDDCLEKYVELLGRGGPEPPARRDLVLLQLRLLAARPGDREAHRQDLGRGDARAAVHAAAAWPAHVTLPEEAILHSAAVGHVDADGEQVPARSGGCRARSARPA